MQISTKASLADLVTETDKATEELIIGHLKSQFPLHSFIGEESVAAGKKTELTNNPTWIIDPIDGTTNFVHKFPQVSISIALLVEKDTKVGIVYNPISNEMYSAKLGQGSYCNGEKLKVSNIQSLQNSLVITGFTSNRDPEVVDKVMTSIKRVLMRSHNIRSTGSAALNMAMIAAGSADVMYSWGLHSWDVAAGDLIIREAGGVVRNMDCSSFDLMSRQLLCGANIELLQQVAPLVEQLEFERD